MITSITNCRMLDCVGDEPIENTTIIVEDGIIKDISQGTNSLTIEARVINAKGRTVLPGLIDAHDHFAVTNNDMGATYFDPPFYTAIRMKNQLEKILNAGFTTLRDGGGGHWSLKKAIEDGFIIGPRLLISGALLSITGGHGDFNLHGEMVYPPDIPFFNLMHICDGEDSCRKAVREQFRKGSDQIKICVTGGCASPNDQAWHLQFSKREIRAMVEEAESVGSYVMAHCLNDNGIRRAVECGVKSIEHGSFMSDETAHLMKEKGAKLVSTLAVVWWAMEKGAKKGASEWFLRKISNPGCSADGASIMEGMIRGAKVALKAGVLVGSGADFFGTMCGGEAIQIKLNKELIGLTPYQALKTSTIINAKILKMEDKIGSITPLKWADIIIVNGNPDEDVNIITKPANIKLVMKQGIILKNSMTDI